ncbi:MAG: hypothetical protein FD188_3542, partial [Ignavibacteria bacterium]
IISLGTCRKLMLFICISLVVVLFSISCCGFYSTKCATLNSLLNLLEQSVCHRFSRRTPVFFRFIHSLLCRVGPFICKKGESCMSDDYNSPFLVLSCNQIVSCSRVLMPPIILQSDPILRTTAALHFCHMLI